MSATEQKTPAGLSELENQRISRSYLNVVPLHAQSKFDILIIKPLG